MSTQTVAEGIVERNVWTVPMRMRRASPQRTVGHPPNHRAAAVDVWWSWLPAVTDDLLTAVEQHRRRSLAPAVARHFTASRSRLREILAGYLGSAPIEVPITTTRQGKPQSPGTGLHYNTSHVGPLMVCAVTTSGPIGIDVESGLSLTDLAIADLILHDRERRALVGVADDRIPSELLRTWTRKEALAKAVGRGLDLDFRSVQTPVMQPVFGARIGRVKGTRWFLWDLDAPDGHAAALAIRRPRATIRTFSFDVPLARSTPDMP